MSNTLMDKNIENLIYEIRGNYVMLASDVAKLYSSETKIINQVVKRNINRFPESFCFQLTSKEWELLRSQNVTSSSHKKEHGGIRYLPYVFSEHGIIMLSGLLKSDIAIEVNIRVINAFVNLRKYISTNLIEQKYINNQVIKTSENIKLLQKSLSKLEENRKNNEIYFEGQIYDAYSKILDIFSYAKELLIIIDAYADKIILDMVRNINIKIILITSTKSKLTQLDIKKYNQQYNNINIIYDNSFHDRYFIIDKYLIYHCGTSLNYIGRKTFSINKLEDNSIIKLLIDNVNKIIN